MGILIKRIAIRIATSQLFVEYTDDSTNLSNYPVSSSSLSSSSSSGGGGPLQPKLMHQIITLQTEAKLLNPVLLAQRLREAYPHLFPIYIDDTKLIPLLRTLCGTTVLHEGSSTAALHVSSPSSPRSYGTNVTNNFTMDDKYSASLSPSNHRTSAASYRNTNATNTNGSTTVSYPSSSSPSSLSISSTASSSTTASTKGSGTGNVNRGLSYTTTPSVGSGVSSSVSSATHPPTTTAMLPSVIANIGDLQRVGPAALQLAKAKMDIVFEANKVRPGDDTFVYDKRADFVPSEESDWD